MYNMNNELITPSGEFGKVHVEWQFPETPQYERGSRWYFFSGALLVVLLGYALFTKNFLFGIILVLFAVLFFIVNSSGRIIRIAITDDGMVLGKKIYGYDDMEKFWIIYDPTEVKNLYIQLKSFLTPRLIISLEDQNPNEVRAALSRFVREDLHEEEEPPMDTLTRRLKL